MKTEAIAWSSQYSCTRVSGGPSQQKKCRAAEMRCLRKLFGISYNDDISNKAVNNRIMMMMLLMIMMLYPHGRTDYGCDDGYHFNQVVFT